MSARIDPGTVKTEKWPATVSRIAVGVGGYPEGKDAVVLAAAIARATQAELMLVAVHPYPLVVLPEELNWTSLEKQAATMLAEVRDSLAPDARMVVETDLSVPRALERVVRREHRDLLVVGSSRHGPDGRVRIGKRSRQLLCHFKCALAIAPRGMHSRPLQELRRIGVGYDGGPESEAALSLAGSIAGAAGAELHLCGVVDRPLALNPLVSVGNGRRGRTAVGGRRPGANCLASRTRARSDQGDRGQHARRGPPRASG